MSAAAVILYFVAGLLVAFVIWGLISLFIFHRNEKAKDLLNGLLGAVVLLFAAAFFCAVGSFFWGLA